MFDDFDTEIIVEEYYQDYRHEYDSYDDYPEYLPSPEGKRLNLEW